MKSKGFRPGGLWDYIWQSVHHHRHCVSVLGCCVKSQFLGNVIPWNCPSLPHISPTPRASDAGGRQRRWWGPWRSRRRREGLGRSSLRTPAGEGLQPGRTAPLSPGRASAGKGAAPPSVTFLIHTLETDPALQMFEIAPRNVAFLTAESELTTFGVPHPSFHHHFAGPPLAHLSCFLSYVGQPSF